MKSAIIFSIFIVLAQGSLFGEFREAMSSLRSGFPKLISDVATDVKQSIDCTIIAVETAFSIGSFFSSRINSKCKGVINENHDKYETPRRTDNDRKELLHNFSPEETLADKHENKNLINKVLKYLEIINKKGVKDAQSTRSNFENEHNLSNVFAFLKKEIEKFSFNIREELTIIESSHKSTIDCIVKYINLLYTLESKSKKDSELNEVRRILNGVSKILDLKVSNEDENEKCNKTLTSLELESDKNNETQSTIGISDGKNYSELNQVRQILDDVSKIVRVNVTEINEDVNDEVQKSLTNIELIPNLIKYDSGLNESFQNLDDASKTLSININGGANDNTELTVTTLEPTFNNEKNDTQSTSAKSVTSVISSNQSNSLTTVTFKSIFTKVLLPTTSSNVNTEINDEQKMYGTEKSAPDELNYDSMDYGSFFGEEPDEESNEDDLEEERRMFEDSQRLNPFLSDVFSKADQSDSNIFEHQF